MGGMGIYWGRRTSGTQARKCAEMQTCVLTLSLGRRTGELQGLQEGSEESVGICKEEEPDD